MKERMNSTIVIESGIASGGGQLNARFIGYVNPQKLLPAFVVPVFKVGDILSVQRVDTQERILEFIPYDKDSIGSITEVKVPLETGIGNPAIHGFIDKTKKLYLQTKRGLQERLRLKLKASKSPFANNHFFVLEVLHYLEDRDEICRQLSIIQNVYATNPAISRNFVELERRRIVQKKTLNKDSDPLIKTVKSGFINFWELQETLPDVFDVYEQAYMKFRLARSFAGQCPRTKNILRGVGISSPKISSTTSFVPFDSSKWRSLKSTIIENLIITEIRYFSGMDVITSVQAVDPTKIFSKYLKKDKRKVVTSTTSRDYEYKTVPAKEIKNIRESFPFSFTS